jgi:HNH endonuclease
MRVLKRDGYRCVVCGRRPADHLDLELHVHHLIPWRMHGPTAEENLVTLCGTCHKGLDPDFEPFLRELARLPGSANPLDPDGTEYKANVRRYREWTVRVQPRGPVPSAHSDAATTGGRQR